MSLTETRDYIAGLNRRYRQNWEMTRLTAQVFHKVQTGKDLELDFPWEVEEKPEPTEEEMNVLREKAKKMERIMNKKNGKGCKVES